MCDSDGHSSNARTLEPSEKVHYENKIRSHSEPTDILIAHLRSLIESPANDIEQRKPHSHLNRRVSHALAVQ